ncbi:hypothetical protein KJ359_011622 [Pestalotiopsis sp. 9143b]|nr:hypothetical protein KJ359_011622 [Pestalotiopsis sp. 9143b]
MADESAGASQTGASSSGNHAAGSQRRTLDDVMRSPSTNAPGVVVLDTTYEEKSRKNSLNPREDLWMSTIDGKVLTKTEYFVKALCGSFKEAATQSISLPEEDPAIFHFVVAFLSRIPSPQPPNLRNSTSGDRIQGEDLRTWLLTYELNLDVYICANKFLLEYFKQAIARCCIDMLESAGADAAQVKVLELCSKLYEGLSESDPLLKMVFARVGFLQPLLWRQAPEETSAFLLEHPEISALILKETVHRREMEHGVSQLPPMEQPYLPAPFNSPYARPVAPMHRARW